MTLIRQRWGQLEHQGQPCCSFDIVHDDTRARQVVLEGGRTEEQRFITDIVVTTAPGHRLRVDVQGFTDSPVVDRDEDNRLDPVSARESRISNIVGVYEEEGRWSITHVGLPPTLPGSVSTPTSLTTGGQASGSQISSNTTASISPTGAALLICAVSARSQGSAVTMTQSDTLAGTESWSDMESASNPVSSDGFDWNHGVAYATAGATPGSGTITFTYSGSNINRTSWVVAEVTGHDSSSPISESNSGGGNGATFQITITDYASGNLLVGGMGQEDLTPGAGGDSTLVATATSGGGNSVNTAMVYDTDAEVDFSVTSGKGQVGVALEIAQAGGGGGFPHSQGVIIG